MRFPCTFTRYVGTLPAGGKAVGSDGLIVDGGGNPIKGSSNAYGSGQYDNILPSRIVSINGWPIQRVAFVGKYAGVGSPVAMPVAVYVYEDSLACWFPLSCSAGASPTYTPGTNAAPSAPIFFDCLALIDFPHAGGVTGDPGDLQSTAPGNAVYLAIVGTGTSPPNGTYQFALAAEMSSKPF